MKVIEQSYQIENIWGDLELIERAGRTCYKSEDKITPDSARKFVESLLRSGHHSVIEHAGATVRFITDRGVTHELVRHRLASYSQESTRYCNYGGEDIQFIRPVWASIPVGLFNSLNTECDGQCQTCDPICCWFQAMISAEGAYKQLLRQGWRPEEARSVLPNSLKTEIVVTANLREWMHIFGLRCSTKAHPQIRQLLIPCFHEFQDKIPVLFDRIGGMT